MGVEWRWAFIFSIFIPVGRNCLCFQLFRAVHLLAIGALVFRIVHYGLMTGNWKLGRGCEGMGVGRERVGT